MEWLSDAVVWLYHWQTLVAGGLALLGAWWTVGRIREQIAQADRHTQSALSRKHTSLRAAMPLTLSGLCDWAKEMAVSLKESKDWLDGDPNRSIVGNFTPPGMPNDQISQLQSFLETTEDRTVIVPLTKIISDIQLIWARTKDFNDSTTMKQRVGVDHELIGNLIKSLQVYVIVEELFDYARGESENGPRNAKWKRVDDLSFRLVARDKEIRQAIKERMDGQEFFWKLDDRP